LLTLAREIEGLGADALPSAVRALAVAYAPDGELAAAVQRAWLASRADKTATLALAWAREQLRLALQGVIEATPPSARGTLALPTETLAWLLLAACESLAHEPPSAVADRLRLLLELTGRASPPA
jgi:Flp pilus assembly protein CpaB